jgi:hypothetical protein
MTQAQAVLQHMKKSETNSITRLHAMTLYNVANLYAVILVLRKRGNNIVTEHKSDLNGNAFVQYRLAA